MSKEGNLEDIILSHLNDGIKEAAEKVGGPMIKKAVEEFEFAIRERLASMVIALVDTSVVIDRCGKDIRILVEHKKKE